MKIDTQHTPGPWKTKREHSAIFVLGDNEPWPSAGHVARVDARRSGAKRGMAVAMHMSETDEANARLIAAAPEMYAALEAALATYREQWVHPGTEKTGTLLPPPAWVVDARAALSAARGQK